MNITGEEEEEYKWTPAITVSDIKLSGMRVHFDPPYPGAVWHHICAQFPENYLFCIKRTFKVKMPLVSKFIELPNNKTYRILVRPYDNYTKPLHKFVAARSYIFLPPYETGLSTIDIPVESPVQNITEKSPGDSLDFDQPISNTLMVSLACLAVAILFAMLGFLIYKRLQKRKKNQYSYRNTLSEAAVPVKLTPLYLCDPTGMVDAHLDILVNQPGLNLERINVCPSQIHGNLEDMINTTANSLVENINHKVVIYSSDNMKEAFKNPLICLESLQDQFCVKFIEKICQNPKIKPYFVCFGEQPNIINHETFSTPPSIISVIKYKEGGGVTFQGTLDLIRKILPINETTLLSLDSKETRRLQSLFEYYHSDNNI